MRVVEVPLSRDEGVRDDEWQPCEVGVAPPYLFEDGKPVVLRIVFNCKVVFLTLTKPEAKELGEDLCSASDVNVCS